MKKEIQGIYKKHKDEIKSRLEEFRKAGKASQEEIFAEMCFCILTPQSKALKAHEAIRKLKKDSILYRGSKQEIRKYLKGVRFPNNKASYIIAARENFTRNGKICIREFLSEKNIFKLRDRLIKKIKGYGFKESSHFLRNIGRGSEIAILDRHILKSLKSCGVIKEVPASISSKKYLSIEKKMKQFSSGIEIPMAALDMVFWYRQTGYFFK